MSMAAVCHNLAEMQQSMEIEFLIDNYKKSPSACWAPVQYYTGHMRRQPLAKYLKYGLYQEAT